MKIIAFGHEKYVGKDHAANFLATEYRLSKEGRGKCIMKKGFADKVKDVAHQLYGWAGLKSCEYYENNTNEKEELLPLLNKTVRQIWIELSNNIKEVYSDTWIDLLLQQSSVDLLLIKDLRFPNEVQPIKSRGGFCIKIERPGIIRTPDVADDALLNYTDWDATIINDGTLGQFHKKVVETCFNLLGIKE